MKASFERIERDIEIITNITATPNAGCTRFSYSKEDKKVREILMENMKELGMEIKIDGVGNIRAKYNTSKTNKGSIMIGSHIDTVANGGKFDGLAGVISALEVIRILKENKVTLNCPVELVIFAEEEGSNFGITMVGSKALTGKYKVEDLKGIKNDKGITGYELMKDFGLEVDEIENQIIKKEEVDYMIELHVEQGGILDSQDIPIGIVEAIAGMTTYKINLQGISNHAGSTPMNLRNDPMVAAAELISNVKSFAENDALDSTVATVGKIFCMPNVSNVIPGEVEFFVDVRDVEQKGIDIVGDKILEKSKEIEKKYGVKTDIEIVGKSKSVKLSKEIINTIEKSALENNYKFKRMNSGAVHDAAMLNNITDVGMIFVPSIDGRSHCPEELTKIEDIELGCNLLLDTVIMLSDNKK